MPPKKPKKDLIFGGANVGFDPMNPNGVQRVGRDGKIIKPRPPKPKKK